MKIGKSGVGSGCIAEERKARFVIFAKRVHGLGFFQFRLGQCCPRHCPRARGAA
jgi:hypothetical protein